MPIVDVAFDIGAPHEVVWRTVLDVTSYPLFMESVQSVFITSENDIERTTAWSVLLKGSVLQWTEREDIDHGALRIAFQQIDGDLERFQGDWLVQPREQGCTVSLLVDFDIGIPLLADMLNPVAAKALEDNSRSMLKQIEQRVSASPIP